MTQLLHCPQLSLCSYTEEAHVASVTQAGVAADHFYSTTIYPTDVFIAGEWLRVKNQRMDAAIAVNYTPTLSAECKLLRDLEVGDLVVIGEEGIRIQDKTTANPPDREFSFMSSSVSSERQVRLIVERLANDLLTYRESGWKVVITAGPVVIHTGGGDALATLIRQGYVQALLGGNAIAVHDIEQALFGTSLGVDMQQGINVRGGHRHHLQAINCIRRCGTIERAVDQGILNRGVMYECVKQGIPFALAGSIRDDGPLPDTITDTVVAQQEYARLLHGADMILMLSSMLHSIGVGNMTPAGVQIVCVDINPAVVTKLCDRGSVESLGVVTDVGLFLNLLVQQLDKQAVPQLTQISG